uniref:FSA_C domain-containing protein n=2 Tax=Mesocestoides corti TaxID=53468 RepID=A0A5K3F7E2_MESCO
MNRFNFDFELPFVDFLPTSVPIKFDIKASSASLCLSLPETSTLLYMLKELHENLKLADRNCKPLKSNPFQIIEETLPNPSGDAECTHHKRYWLQCWRARIAHIKIGYTYHPIPWVSEFWQFLPVDWSKAQSSHGPLNIDKVIAPRDPEESALGNLRPEGSRAHGPTESELIRANFDPSYLPADRVDVHVAIPSSQLLFYGALVRHILHVKEAYFGCYQTPITTENLKDYGLTEKGDGCAVPSSVRNQLGEPNAVVDPREYRPLGVRVSIAIHSLQAHLPMHTSSEIPLCPTAFLDCIGFEMDKGFYETKLQLLFSPVLLCVFDKCNAYRPPNASNLCTGRAQLTGFELRGHAMFSNRGLPLKAETVEYAWLFEITCGTLSGQITAPQLSSLVHCVSSLIFSAIDMENAILSRRSDELCQHALLPMECPFWLNKSPGAELCPTELELKYRLLRFNLDGVELAVVEAGTCLMVMLDAVRVARCNMHDVHSRDGISVFLPRVQFLQLIKPIEKAPTRPLTKEGISWGPFSQATSSSQPWLEAGSVGFGPVHIHSGISGLNHAYREPQLAFLRHHDATTHRLWFFWLSDDAVAPAIAAVRCGCYGNCAFFGPNASGKMLLDEVVTGIFSRRAVFVSNLKQNTPTSPVATNATVNPSSISPGADLTSERNLGVNFGESLLEPDQLLFQLHNHNICSDTSNGFALMRMEAVMADESVKFETTPTSRTCSFCSSDEEADSFSDGDSYESESSTIGVSIVSGEGGQNFDLRGRLRRHSSPRQAESHANQEPVSVAYFEKSLVANEEVGGTGVVDPQFLDDNLSITSLLDDLTIGPPPSPPPPPPPPRQAVSGTSATRASTNSVPLFTEAKVAHSNYRRGSTNSFHSDRGLSHTGDDSTLSGDEFTAKFVDLQGQLNRPITESSLLRTAYERHLNRYINNVDICPPLRLKRRWRVCRRFRNRLQDATNAGDGVNEGKESVSATPKCNCRIGIAKAPEFLCSATGFSFRSMIDATSGAMIAENPATCNALISDTNCIPSSFRISDLRPLLYPHCCNARLCESSTASVSRSSTTVSVIGPVDIFLTPLCAECIDRYITIMAAVLANSPPGSVIDELHFKCLLSAGRQGKVLFEEQLKQRQPRSVNVSRPQQPRPPQSSTKRPTSRSIFFDQFSENAVKFHKLSLDDGTTVMETPDETDAQCKRSGGADSPSIACGTKQPPPASTTARYHLAEENNLVGLLSLGRVNIGFMQIYAIEDVVTVDSLSLGLRDLTCVSLLTLAVDTVKVEVLNNKRILHYGVDHGELTPTPLNCATDVIARPPRGERALSEFNEERNDEDASTAASPLLSSPIRCDKAWSSVAQGLASVPCSLGQLPLGNVGATASSPVTPTPTPAKVVSATEVRHTERLVCNFSISRIHSQLRRLTRESSFTPEVLLTAIPFSASRVFFAFDSDQQCRVSARKSPPIGELYTGVHGQFPAASISPPPLSPHLGTAEPELPGHSAGWIMFESGMEELTLLFVQRKGYGDSLEDKSDQKTVKKQSTRVSANPSFEWDVEAGEESADNNMESGNNSAKEPSAKANGEKDSAEEMKNAFLLDLHVKTVWLNFPAPKHLPNKRRVEIIRSDWNFLSTVTPTVNAWIGPCNRLVYNSKHLVFLADRRILSVLACLMMETVNGEVPLPDFRKQLRFSSLEDEAFSAYSTWRTPDARRLRYDPSCQIFTALRRHLQALRKQYGEAYLTSCLDEWLRESVLPEKMMLLRGLFLILREWRVAVDVMMLPVTVPVSNRNQAVFLSKNREGIVDNEKVVFSPDMEERRPSGLTLRMFELMTRNAEWNTRKVSPLGDHQTLEVTDFVDDVDEVEEEGHSDVEDVNFDETLIHDPRIRCENSILRRFLQDAQHGIRQSESSANVLDANDSSPTQLSSRVVLCDPSRLGTTTENFVRNPQSSSLDVEPGTLFCGETQKVSESEKSDHRKNSLQRRSPITPEDVNQVNHLKGQFRFVDDAQRLFRPLLEAIGVNIKGVRRSTLMKKFGGLFAAEGMLDCFQVEICDSLDNPLQKIDSLPFKSSVGAKNVSTRSLKASTSPKGSLNNASAGSRSTYNIHNPSAQRALMCHRISTKVTLRDVVGFSKSDNFKSRLGDVELRSTTTKITAALHFDNISQHSNMPLFRLTHQFVTMIYCAQDAQKSADRRRNSASCNHTVDAKGSIADTAVSGSTLKSRPDYVRLSGQSQDSTTDSTAFQQSSSVADANVAFVGSAPTQVHQKEATSIDVHFDSSLNSSLRKLVETSVNFSENKGEEQGETYVPAPSSAVFQPNVGVGVHQSSIPGCWRRMLRYIDLYSTVPETKNITTKASAMPTILEEDLCSSTESAHKDEPAQQTAAATSRFSFMGGVGSGSHHDTVDLEAGVRRHSVLSTSHDSVAKREHQVALTSPWFKTSERTPMVVFITMRVRQMTVSAVLSEVNLTAAVRNIHGSFTKTDRVRGHSLFKETSSNFSLSGHFGDADVRLVEGIGKFAQEAAFMKTSRSHVLLSCARSSRHSEKNACSIGLGRVEVTVPHHPVRLHGMVQRQARHLSTTVSEFLQLPTNLAASSSSIGRRRTCTDGASAATLECTNRRAEAEGLRPIGKTGISEPPTVISMTAVARGLTVSVSLHPTLNAVYTVDPVYFLGQIGPRGYLDINVTKHMLRFESVRLPVIFPRAVCLRLPKILAFVARRQCPGGRCVLDSTAEPVVPCGLHSREGLYIDVRVSVGVFEQCLPSDMLNYIVVVVKLFMKEINEVIRKMAGEQQTWSSSASAAAATRSQPRSVYQQTQHSRRCSAFATTSDPTFEAPSASSIRSSILTRFSFRLKLGGIRLLATTANGAVKFETSEMHVELSNRVERTHTSWYTDSSSSFSARPYVCGPDASTPTPHRKKSEYWQPTRDSNLPPQAPSDTLSATNSESILIYAKIDRLSIELGHLDQDAFYKVWAPEFRTLAFFRTAIALRSLLAEEVNSATNQQLHRNPHPKASEEIGSRSGHAQSVPPRTGDVSDCGGAGSHSSAASGASSVVFTPVDEASGGQASHPVEQEAFLVYLRRPIIWAKPSAFDRAILIWMVYNSEFAKWNEHMQQLDTLSGVHAASPKGNKPRSAPPPHSTASPPPSSPSSMDNTTPGRSGSPPNRGHSREPTMQPVVGGSKSILFFQLNVEDLGICLPTNILQMSPQSMEVDSRTALVLTLEQSRISACVRGSLASEGEFTDFCLRFDDDFNVGSDDWKPDRGRSTITVKKEDHLVVMNSCVVPSGTFRVCWRAFESLRADERGRWLVKIHYQMRGLDVHMDDNIGRRLKALFDILTIMTSTDGEQQTVISGEGSANAVATYKQNSSTCEDATNAFPCRCDDPEYELQPSNLLDVELQHQQFSQYKRFKLSNLRKKTAITSSYSQCGLRRTGSLVSEERQHRQTNNILPTPTLLEDCGELVSAAGSPNASCLSASSRAGSIYFDADDPATGMLAADNQPSTPSHLLRGLPTLQIDKPSEYKTDTHSLRDDCPFDVENPAEEAALSVLYSEQDESQRPPTPPPRTNAFISSVRKPLQESQKTQPQTQLEEPSRSSLLFELDINIHVDSGKCGLHPRLPKVEEGCGNGCGSQTWPTSPGIGSPLSLQDDPFKAYLSRYKRHLSQDPLLKPTDISVFFLPALDVGLHYKSHTKYDLWNQQVHHVSSEEERKLEHKLEDRSFFNNAAATKIDATASLTEPEDRPMHDKGVPPAVLPLACTNGSPDVGRSADLYASIVLQKLPQSLIVHPGLLDFLEQALENLPVVMDSASDDAQSTQPKSSVQLNDVLVTSTRTFLVDVVVHLRMQPSTIRFLCLPSSQMQCLITLPSLNAVFSSERLAEGSLDGEKPVGRLSLPVDMAENVALGDIVSASGLNMTIILNEFRMSVFHPYGGGIGGGLRASSDADGTSPGDSLTLKVRDIRLNISRTVQTNIVNHQQQAQQPSDGAASDVRTATATMNSYVTASSGANTISLHNIVRFSGVVDIGVAEFKCDTRRSLEILHIPKAWYRKSLARALFIGKDSRIPQSANSATAQRAGTTDDEDDNEVDDCDDDDDDSVSQDEGEVTRSSCTPPPVSEATNTLASWLQKGPRLRSKIRIGAGTAGAPIKPTISTSASMVNRRSATTPREGLNDSLTDRFVSNTTTLTPLVGPDDNGAGGGPSSTSRLSSVRVVSWQALPIFYAKIGHLDVRTYMGSAMGLTKLDVRNIFCDGRLYQDSSKRRQGSLGAGINLCHFTSEKGVVGGEFTLLDLDSRINFKEDPQCDPQHSAELLLRGFQLSIEYMNTNLVFLRLNQAEMYLNDEWRLREADHLSVGKTGVEKAKDIAISAPRKISASSPLVDAEDEATTPQRSAAIGAPPVYVMISGEINWDQLQVAIARTTTVDLVRSARKVREYFEEQLREGRNSWIGQGDYLLRPDSSTVCVAGNVGATPVDSLSLPTESGETLEGLEPATATAALGFSCTEENVDTLLQRHWQRPMLEAIQACLVHIGTQAPQVRRNILESTAPADENSVPPVLGGSLQLAGNTLALACFAGTFRSAPDWAVFDMQQPTICFETEAQREPRTRPSGATDLLTHKKSVAFVSEASDEMPESIDAVGGWLNVRQVLSFDLGHQLQYRPQTAYVLRVRRGREQNPVKLPTTPTISEWLEFMFKAVDNTVLSHVRGANPHYISDMVKLTDFSVDFGACLSSTMETPNGPIGAPTSHILPERSSTLIPIVTVNRPNPLKPPTEAEILFVLPSVSMRLTSDQRQTMAHPKISELFIFAQDLQQEKAAAAAEAAKQSKTKGTYFGTNFPEPSLSVDVGENETRGREDDGSSAKVHLSFQTDLHGVIQLGLLDVPWLPLLIRSYINEQMHDIENMAVPDPTYAVTPRTLELAKEGLLPGSCAAASTASTASPIVQDLRSYDVIHWNLSPECRWLLASNIAVPAFDMLLEKVGFQRARTTIPKWLQRGVLDHLDSAVACLVLASLRLTDEQRHERERKKKMDRKLQERRSLDYYY